MTRFLTITAFLILAILPRTADAAEVTFFEQARVSEGIVRLEDVARVHPRDEREAAMLKEVLLGFSPEGGETMMLEPSYLRRRLEQFGFWGPGHRVALPMKPIVVRRSDVRNRLSDVEEAVKILVERHYGPSVSRVEVAMTDPENLLTDLPKGLVSVEALDLDFLRDHSHETRLALAVRVGDQTWQGRFPLTVRLWRREIHAVHRLGMRLDIREEDVELADVEIVEGLPEGCRSLDEIVGRRLKRLVPEGRRVLAEVVLPPMAIEKGQVIRLERDAGDLKISLHGRALNDGRVDDELLFEMPNGTRVRARVTGEGRARLLETPAARNSKRIVIGGDS